jgi:hypothetical protein
MVICTISGAYGPSLALTGKSSRVIVYGKHVNLCHQRYADTSLRHSVTHPLTGNCVYHYSCQGNAKDARICICFGRVFDIVHALGAYRLLVSISCGHRHSMSMSLSLSMSMSMSMSM